MKKTIYLLLSVLAVAACASSESTDNGQTVDSHLRLFSIVPPTGEAGSAAIISGINFTDAVSVKVGEAAADIVSVTSNRIQITLPANEEGTYPVVLTQGNETVDGVEYTYVADGEAKMTLVNIVPNAGFEGSELVIYGQGFGDDPAALHVFFDETEGTVTAATRNIIHVTAPAHAEGTAFVTIKSATQEGGTLRYTYRHAPVFQLLEIAPTSGKAGSTAVITGELFSPVPEENIVTINGVQATVTAASEEKLTIVLPENPEGTYSINLKVGDKETSGLSFTYLPKSYIINYLVGNGANANIKDGIGDAASVHLVQDINLAPDGKLWFTCRGKSTIMTFDMVTREAKTLVADATILKNCWQGSFNSKGVYYVAAKAADKLATVTQEGIAMTYTITNPDGTAATTTGPMDIAFDNNSDDIMYVACRDLTAPGASGKGCILKVVNGVVQATWTALNIGTMQMGPDGYLYWGRDGASAGLTYLYRTDTNTGDCTPVIGTGTAPTAATFTNGEEGQPLKATVGIIRDIFFCKDGSMLFTEQGTATLRKLTPKDGDYTQGTVTTIAGIPCTPSATAAGNYDGAYALSANLSSYVYGVWAPDDMSAIYLADGFNFRVVKLVMED